MQSMISWASKVFPASAGVILLPMQPYCVTTCFPRIRGGDPRPSAVVRCRAAVFPASAGVILRVAVGYHYTDGFPRIRGGDPVCTLTVNRFAQFSPHPRG